METPTTNFPSSDTSSSSLTLSPSTQPYPPQFRPCKPGPTLSASYSPHKKIVSRENPSATAEPATPKAVQWHNCVATPHTFNTTVPPAQLLLRRFDTRTSGSKSAIPRPRQPYASWSAQQARPLASRHKTLARAPSERGRKWRSSRNKSIRTRSGSSGGDGATQFSATSTQHQRFLQIDSSSIYSNMATTCSSRQRTPPASAKRRHQITARPPIRGFWGSGTGSV